MFTLRFNFKRSVPDAVFFQFTTDVVLDCMRITFYNNVHCKPLRNEYAMCKDIYDRSDDIQKTVERIEFPQLVEQERQKAELKKNGREER